MRAAALAAREPGSRTRSLPHAPLPAVFDRLAPKLDAAKVEHRINVLRCSQAARSVGDVIVANSARISAFPRYGYCRCCLHALNACAIHAASPEASMVVMAMKQKNALVEALMGSCCSHVVHRCPVPVVVVRNLPAPPTAAPESS